MNSIKFTGLSSNQKKKIVKSAVRGANKDQKLLMERYEKIKNEEQSSSGSFKLKSHS